MRSIRLFLVLLAGVLFAPAVMAFDQAVLGDTEFVSHPRENLLTHGQPEPHEMVIVERAGGRHVVNLRGEDEFDAWDAEALVTVLGMQYHHLPVANAGALSRERVARFDGILETIGDEPALIYCASSNRVGAMFALRAAWLQGMETEAAIAVGREHGLTRLEGHVRELLTDTSE